MAPGPDGFSLDEALQMLTATPELLRSWLQGLSDTWLEQRSGAGAWSVSEIVAHLVHGERTDWIQRVRHLLRYGEGRPFPPFEREGNAEAAGQPIGDLVEEFARARAESLQDLLVLALGENDLDRRGMHPALGAVTLRQLLATWVVHDLSHVDQIARTLAGRWRDETGPWNRPDYLGVLHLQKRR